MCAWFAALLGVSAAIGTLEQARIRSALDAGILTPVRSFIATLIGRCSRVIVAGVKAELWLDGGRVNAVLVETFSDLTSKLHVTC